MQPDPNLRRLVASYFGSNTGESSSRLMMKVALGIRNNERWAVFASRISRGPSLAASAIAARPRESRIAAYSVERRRSSLYAPRCSDFLALMGHTRPDTDFVPIERLFLQAAHEKELGIPITKRS